MKLKGVGGITKCSKLEAKYRVVKGLLSGPYKIVFNTKQGVLFRVEITQCGIRTINIESEKEVKPCEFYKILRYIELLLVLFDGYFLLLVDLNLYEHSQMSNRELKQSTTHFQKQRVAYYDSVDFCKGDSNSLIQYDQVLSEELFLKWIKLNTELDIVNQMYLYSLGGKSLTVDIRCAFLIEIAEPLVEIVKKYKRLFTELKPGKRGTTLKMCLKAIINEYGEEIFKKELQQEEVYEKTLELMVDSRVRIMHIKKEKQNYFNGKESTLYAIKMSLLYRCIMLDLLEVKKDFYREKLIARISYLDSWDGVLTRLLDKLKTKGM